MCHETETLLTDKRDIPEKRKELLSLNRIHRGAVGGGDGAAERGVHIPEKKMSVCAM